MPINMSTVMLLLVLVLLLLLLVTTDDDAAEATRCGSTVGPRASLQEPEPAKRITFSQRKCPVTWPIFVTKTRFRKW